MTIKVKCVCYEGDAAKYQDLKYGKATRVANKTGKPGEYRCTVCGKIHRVESK